MSTQTIPVDAQLMNRILSACQESSKKVRELVASNPNTLSVPDKNGNLLLHRLVRMHLELLKRLTDLPWHRSSDSLTHSLQNVAESIRFVLKQYPAAAKIQNCYGYLPIHIAIINGVGYRDGRNNISPYDEMENGFDEMIKLLVKAYPSGLMAASNKHRDFPIHLACRKNTTVELIEFMVESSPESLQEKNSDGKIPLYIAFPDCCKPFLCQRAMVYLLQKTPSQAFDPQDLLHQYLCPTDFLGRCFYDAELRVFIIRCFVDRFPRLAEVPTPKGDLLLHVACMRFTGHSPKEGVWADLEAIVDAYPSALLSASRAGRTPCEVLEGNGGCSEHDKLLFRQRTQQEELRRAFFPVAKRFDLDSDVSRHLLSFLF